MKILIREEVMEKLREVLSKRSEIKLAYLMGSIAERAISYNDVDIAILIDCDPADKLILMSKILDGVCKALSLRDDDVDIVPIDEVDWLFKYKIVKGIKLVDKNGAGMRLLEEVNSAYPEIHLLQEINLREWLEGDDPRSIDWGIVKRGMDYVFEALEILRSEILNKSAEEVVESTLLRLTLERLVHVITESIVNVARHVISVKGWGPAETYQDYISLLHRQGVIPEKLAEDLSKFIAWRNILMHKYIQIDHSKLYEDSKKLAEVVREFERQIIKFKGSCKTGDIEWKSSNP